MRTPELIRYYTFWGLDFIKGSSIRKHFNDLQKNFASPSEGAELAKHRLKKFLDNACKTTPFYNKFASFRKLEDFPVIQKKTVRENYNEFFSTAYKEESLIPVTTSGSYGTPFTFYLTKEKKARQSAEIIFFGQWSGYKVGEKHAYARVIHASKLKLFLQNKILMSPTSITEQWLEQQRQYLRQKRVKFIIGYTSLIETIARYCEKKGDGPEDFTIKSVIISSETLYEDVRKKLEDIFGCKVVSRYSTEEFGVLAQERVGEHKHTINTASYVIEILDLNKDIPAKPGELGRIVVTDLFSHAMPLIRYDIGDLGIISPKQQNQIPTLEKLEGRKVESVYDPSGTRISPFNINGTLRDQQNIIQFQFIQKGISDYVLKLVTLDSFKEEQIIRDRITALLGNQANLKVEYVDLIPPLPSGKRPYIINEYNKTIDN